MTFTSPNDRWTHLYIRLLKSPLKCALNTRIPLGVRTDFRHPKPERKKIYDTTTHNKPDGCLLGHGYEVWTGSVIRVVSSEKSTSYGLYKGFTDDTQ